MSHRKHTLGGPNIHRTGDAAKPDAFQKVPTLSQAKAQLAASFRRAGYTQREAALKVAELVGRIRARAVAA